MSTATGPADDVTNRALAYVCRRLDYLRGQLILAQGTSGDPVELHALIEAATAAQRPGQHELRALLEALHIQVQAAGDALGLWQAAEQQEAADRSPRLPGIADDIPFEPLYRCPISRCAGRQPNQFTVFPLTCTISGRNLERTIL